MEGKGKEDQEQVEKLNQKNFYVFTKGGLFSSFKEFTMLGLEVREWRQENSEGKEEMEEQEATKVSILISREVITKDSLPSLYKLRTTQ